MEKFIACMCDNELDKLIISGEPQAEELFAAWQELFLEYCDLAEATETKYRVRLQYEIAYQKSLHTCVSGWLKILVDGGYHKEIAGFVCKLYPEVKLNFDNPEEYQHDIAVIKSEMATLGFDLKVKEAEYSAILSAQSTQDSVNREYFLKLIFNINRYTKANPAITLQSSVEMYCVALKAFVAELEAKEKMISDAGI